LAEILRTHIQNVRKNPLEFKSTLTSPDLFQMHLDTRFKQLQVAMELELWQVNFYLLIIKCISGCLQVS
jgi:translation initiation factor 3 subunit A